MKKVKHKDDYVYSLWDGKDINRYIFYNVELTQFEKDKVEEFEKYIKENNFNLPEEYINHIYKHFFNIIIIGGTITTVLKWFTSPSLI